MTRGFYNGAVMFVAPLGQLCVRRSDVSYAGGNCALGRCISVVGRITTCCTVPILSVCGVSNFTPRVPGGGRVLATSNLRPGSAKTELVTRELGNFVRDLWVLGRTCYYNVDNKARVGVGCLLGKLTLKLSLGVLSEIYCLFCDTSSVSFFLSTLTFFTIVALFLLSSDVGGLLLANFDKLFFVFFYRVSVFFEVARPSVFVCLSKLLTSPFTVVATLILACGGMGFPRGVGRRPSASGGFEL